MAVRYSNRKLAQLANQRAKKEQEEKDKQVSSASTVSSVKKVNNGTATVKDSSGAINATRVSSFSNNQYNPNALPTTKNKVRRNATANSTVTGSSQKDDYKRKTNSKQTNRQTNLKIAKEYEERDRKQAKMAGIDSQTNNFDNSKMGLASSANTIKNTAARDKYVIGYGNVSRDFSNKTRDLANSTSATLAVKNINQHRTSDEKSKTSANGILTAQDNAIAMLKQKNSSTGTRTPADLGSNASATAGATSALKNSINSSISDGRLRTKKISNYVGNVDISNRPIVNNGDGSYSTTYTSSLAEWVGGEEDGHYRLAHYTPITSDGNFMSDDEAREYVQDILQADDPMEADKKENGGLGILYKVDETYNGKTLDDSNLDAAAKAADKWDSAMHDEQEALYKDYANKNILNADSMGLYEDTGNTSLMDRLNSKDTDADIETNADKDEGARAYQMLTDSDRKKLERAVETAYEESQFDETTGKIIPNDKKTAAESVALKKELLASGLSEDVYHKAFQWYQKRYDKRIQEEEERAIQSDVLDSNEKYGTTLTALKYAAKNAASFIPESINSIGESIEQALGKPVNPYARGYRMQNNTQAADTAVMENTNTSLGQHAYSMATSAARSLELGALAAGTGGIAGGIFGTGTKAAKAATAAANVITTGSTFGAESYENGLRDGLESGLSEKQAVATALAKGVNETVFEYISLGTLAEMYNVGGVLGLRKGIKGILLNHGLQGLFEGSEEVATNYANRLADDYINGGLSEYNQNVAKYGKEEADRIFATQNFESGAEGFLVGWITGGIATAANLSSRVSNAKTILNNEESYNSAVENALKMDESSEAYKIAKKAGERKLTAVEVADMVASSEGKATVFDTLKKDLKKQGKSSKEADAIISNVAEAIDSGDTSNLTEEEQDILESVTDENNYTTEKAAESVRNTAYEAQAEENYKKAVDKVLKKTVSVDEENGVDASEIGELTKNKKDGYSFVNQKTGKKQNVTGSSFNSSETAQIMYLANNMQNESRAKAYAENYDPAVSSAVEYDRLFNGVVNAVVNQDATNIGEVLNSITGVDKLSDDALSNIMAYAIKSKGEINTSAMAEEQLDLVKQIATKRGVDVQIGGTQTKSGKAIDYKGQNGFFDPETNTIYISPDATNPASVIFSHEYVHWTKQNDIESYNDLKKNSIDLLKVIDSTGELSAEYQDLFDNRYASYSDEIEDYRQQLRNEGKNELEIREAVDDYVEEEMMAHMTEAVMEHISNMSEKEIKSLSSEISHDQTLAEKVKTFIHNLISKIKNILKGYKATSSEAVALEENLNNLQLFEKSLLESMSKEGEKEGQVSDLRNSKQESNNVEKKAESNEKSSKNVVKKSRKSGFGILNADEYGLTHEESRKLWYAIHNRIDSNRLLEGERGNLIVYPYFYVYEIADWENVGYKIISQLDVSNPGNIPIMKAVQYEFRKRSVEQLERDNRLFENYRNQRGNSYRSGTDAENRRNGGQNVRLLDERRPSGLSISTGDSTEDIFGSDNSNENSGAGTFWTDKDLIEEVFNDITEYRYKSSIESGDKQEAIENLMLYAFDNGLTEDDVYSVEDKIYDENGKIIPLSKKFEELLGDKKFSKKSSSNSYEAYDQDGSAKKILEEGIKLIDSGAILSDETIDGIAGRLLNQQKSSYSKKDFSYNLKALFSYLKKNKNATFKDLMRISSEIASPVVKESSSYSKDSGSQRTFNLALRIYQEYFKAIGKNDVADRIDTAVKRVTERYEARIENAKVRREEIDLRKKITTLKSQLDRMLTHPTKGSHVPQNLVSSVVEVVDAINTDTDRMTYKARDAAKKFSEAYDEIRNDPDFGYTYDEQIAKYIRDIRDIMSDKTISELNKEDLEKVHTILNAITFQIRAENKLLSENRNETIYDLKVKGISELEATKGFNENSFLSRTANAYNSQVLNVLRLLNKAFGYRTDSEGQHIAKLLKDGEIHMYQLLRKYNNSFEDVTGGNTIKEKQQNRKNILDLQGKKDVLGKAKVDESTWVTVKQLIGDEEIRIPKAMRLSLIMHLYNKDSIRHLAFGGVRVPNLAEYERGNVSGAFARGEIFDLGLLTDEDKATAKKLIEEFEKWEDLPDGSAKYVINEDNPLVKKYRAAVEAVDNYLVSSLDSKYEDKLNKLLDERDKAKSKNDRDIIQHAINDLRNQQREEYQKNRADLIKAKQQAWDAWQEGRAEAYKFLDDMAEKRAMSLEGILRSDLSEYEEKYLDRMENFFWKETRKDINETSFKLYGYKKATVHNYYPLAVDSAFITNEDPSMKFDKTLEGMGIMKERIISKRPILLEDATSVVERQMQQVSKWAGYTVELRDVKSILNNGKDNISLRDMLAKKWGFNSKNKTGILNMIDQSIADIESSRSESNIYNAFFNKIRSNFAGATLTGNVGVMIKQAASYPTAAAELDYASLAKAMSGYAKHPIAEIEERTPLMDLRRKGLSTQELGEISESKSYNYYLKWFTGMISWMDVRTVNALEYASKFYIDSHTDLEEGTDEYWDAVTEKFNDVIRATQPNYTTLERPEVLKNQNALLRTLFMFKTQPIQNYGILYDAINEYSAKKKLYGKGSSELKESGKRLSRAISSNIVAQLTFGVMSMAAKFLHHSIKDFKDDDDKISIEKIAKALADSVLSAEAGMFVGGSELYDLISSKITGDKYYGLSDSLVDMFNDFTDALANVTDTYDDLVNSVDTSDTKKAEIKLKSYVRVLATKTAEMFGIPASNVYKPINSMYSYVEDAISGKLFSSQGFLTDTSDDVPSQEELMYDAWDNGSKDEFDQMYKEFGAKYQKNNNKSDEETKAYMQSTMKSYIVKKYKNDKISTDDAVEGLKYIGLSDEKVTDAVKKAANSKYQNQEIPVNELIDIYSSLGIDDDSLDTAISNQIGNAFKKNTISAKEAKNELKKLGYEGEDLEKKFANWADSVVSNELGDDYSITEYANALDDYDLDESEESSKISGAIKEQYKAGEFSKKKAISYLVKEAGLDESEAYWETESWEYSTKYGHLEQVFDDGVSSGAIDGTELKKIFKEYEANGMEAKEIPGKVGKDYAQDYVDGKNKANIYAALLNVYRLAYGDEATAKKKLNTRLKNWYSTYSK